MVTGIFLGLERDMGVIWTGAFSVKRKISIKYYTPYKFTASTPFAKEADGNVDHCTEAVKVKASARYDMYKRVILI